eukprot:COSAG01_NODE_72308_length_253_cov_0.870130_1_plen_45_part_10
MHGGVGAGVGVWGCEFQNCYEIYVMLGEGVCVWPRRGAACRDDVC